MPSFTDRLNAAIGTVRPASRPQTRKRRQFGKPWERAGMSKSDWLRWQDERQQQLIDEALAYASLEAAAIMQALPGCIVREVRLVPTPEEPPALADVGEAGDAEATDMIDVTEIENAAEDRSYEPQKTASPAAGRRRYGVSVVAAPV